MDENGKAQNGTIVRHRSTQYPAFSLATAVEKLKSLHAAQKRNAVHVDVAITTIGYKATSSSGQRALAALIYYGLVSEEGSGANRKVRITDTGLKILVLPEEDADHAEALREAARKPRIFRDMMQEWPNDLPDDAAIRKYLTFDRNYNDEAIGPIIAAFRDNYNYAGLGNRDILSADENDNGATAEQGSVSAGRNGHSDQQHGSEDTQAQAGTAGRRSAGNPGGANMNTAQLDGFRVLHVPLPGDRMAVLQLPVGLSKGDLEFLNAYVKLMEGALVFRTGSAVWHNKDADQPIEVESYLGEKDGRHYVKTTDSQGGVPLDEVSFEGEE